MTMNDGNTTLDTLKEQVHQLCLRKGWGVEGVQNPQQVAMAMTVEMSELLEHFQWLNPEDVAALMAGKDPARVAMIGEEFADVMMYGLQLMYVLGADVTEHVEKKIARVMKRPENYYEDKRRLREDFEEKITG
jgi:NTP pyrophosphatase (non-canonical NTP hydrolase)